MRDLLIVASSLLLVASALLVVGPATAAAAARATAATAGSSSSTLAPPCAPYTTVNVEGHAANASLAAVALAGLLNRRAARLFVLHGSQDRAWQQLLLAGRCNVSVAFADPIAALVASVRAGTARNVVLYDDAALLPGGDAVAVAARGALPSVVTLCGVNDAVPLASALYAHLRRAHAGALAKAVVVLDTRGGALWATPAEAVAYAMRHALARTTSLSFTPGSLLAGGGDIADLIVAKRLFAHYLGNACVPGTANNTILREIVRRAPFAKPIRVYGYNGQDAFLGGDLFEAETDCISSMGQIASSGARNLAFWSQLRKFNASAPRGSPLGPLRQPQRSTPRKRYNASKIYVALVSGDNDNLAFDLGFTREHMLYRQRRCAANRSQCFPFSWTMSPNLIELAPELLRFYYEQGARSSGRDTFMMPPSGTLYAYPGMMPPGVQAAYVRQQNAQASIMDTTSSIHWEWFFAWAGAFDNYFPRYVGSGNATATTTKNFFLNDVPWPVPIPPMLLEYFQVVGDPASPATNVVAFRPIFTWQQGGGGGFDLTPAQVADWIGALPPGTVAYAYVIQNTDPKLIFDAVESIANPAVELVMHADLGDLARQAAAARV